MCWLCRLADEVERLQPLQDKVTELEARIAAYQRELADARAKQGDDTNEEVSHLQPVPTSCSAFLRAATRG